VFAEGRGGRGGARGLAPASGGAPRVHFARAVPLLAVVAAHEDDIAHFARLVRELAPGALHVAGNEAHCRPLFRVCQPRRPNRRSVGSIRGLHHDPKRKRNATRAQHALRPFARGCETVML